MSINFYDEDDSDSQNSHNNFELVDKVNEEQNYLAP